MRRLLLIVIRPEGDRLIFPGEAFHIKGSCFSFNLRIDRNKVCYLLLQILILPKLHRDRSKPENHILIRVEGHTVRDQVVFYQQLADIQHRAQRGHVPGDQFLVELRLLDLYACHQRDPGIDGIGYLLHHTFRIKVDIAAFILDAADDRVLLHYDSHRGRRKHDGLNAFQVRSILRRSLGTVFPRKVERIARFEIVDQVIPDLLREITLISLHID